jgi:hypothetical protein
MMTYTEWKKTGKRSNQVTISADDSYKAWRKVIDDRLARLRKSLEAMDKDQADCPKDWGWTGNAQHVAELIDKALGFIEGDEIYLEN